MAYGTFKDLSSTPIPNVHLMSGAGHASGLERKPAFQVVVGLSDGLLWLMYNGHHPESRGDRDSFPSPTHTNRVAQLPPPPIPQQFGTTLMQLVPSRIPNSAAFFEGGIDKDGSAISSLLQDRQQ